MKSKAFEKSNSIRTITFDSFIAYLMSSVTAVSTVSVLWPQRQHAYRGSNISFTSRNSCSWLKPLSQQLSTFLVVWLLVLYLEWWVLFSRKWDKRKQRKSSCIWRWVWRRRWVITISAFVAISHRDTCFWQLDVLWLCGLSQQKGRWKAMEGLLWLCPFSWGWST